MKWSYLLQVIEPDRPKRFFCPRKPGFVLTVGPAGDVEPVKVLDVPAWWLRGWIGTFSRRRLERLERSAAIERLERLERTNPRDERSEAVERLKLALRLA